MTRLPFFHNADSGCHLPEELRRPDSQRLLIFHKGCHVLPRLVDVQPVYGSMHQLIEVIPPQSSSAAPMAGLPHPLLKMIQIKLRMMGGIPYLVVPVTSLDQVVPPAEEQSMEFACKKAGKGIAAHRKRYRLEQIAGGGCKTGWRFSSQTPQKVSVGASP
jgi:hypothetical protein